VVSFAEVNFLIMSLGGKKEIRGNFGGETFFIARRGSKFNYFHRNLKEEEAEANGAHEISMNLSSAQRINFFR